MVSNALKASIARSTAATMMNGITSGRVMWRKSCQLLAPSMVADSYGSFGRAARPPSTISIVNGVHCHVSTMASAANHICERDAERVAELGDRLYVGQSGSANFARSNQRVHPLLWHVHVRLGVRVGVSRNACGRGRA